MYKGGRLTIYTYCCCIAVENALLLLVCVLPARPLATRGVSFILSASHWVSSSRITTTRRKRTPTPNIRFSLRRGGGVLSNQVKVEMNIKQDVFHLFFKFAQKSQPSGLFFILISAGITYISLFFFGSVELTTCSIDATRIVDAHCMCRRQWLTG